MKRALICSLLVSGCAFSEGDPYGVVSAELDARYELREDRDVGDGFQKLTSEYEVKLEAFELEIDLVELIDTGGEEALAFDPANPPPGYSLCHGGHCHADDGRLVDYEDIARELAGSGEGAQVAVRLSAGQIDLLSDAVVPLACEGSCVVGLGHLGLLRASVRSLAVRGTVRDGLSPPRIDALPFAAQVSLLPEEGQVASALETSVAIPLDDDHAPYVAVRLLVYPSAALFDEVDFGSAPRVEGELTLEQADAVAMKNALFDSELGVVVARTE